MLDPPGRSEPPGPEQAVSRRARTLRALSDETFDVLVIGGGITGAGIARDAALRGLKVALVEKLDFASGTSSKSSKLVHGGLRYLEQAEFKLVFESVNERRLLTDKARHLVRPSPFLVTHFKGDRHLLPTIDFGLWLYESLCLFRVHKLHRTYGKKKTLQLEPGLRGEGLTGGIVYYDCQTDDARLTLENVLDATALGAVVANHVRAGKLLRDDSGKVCGAEVTDVLSDQRLAARAKVVINATGPWSDEVRALHGDAPILKPTRGSHVVVDAARLPLRHALMMLAPSDRRAVFAIPWGPGRTVVGTTDTFFDGHPDGVHATREDVEYLLATANHYVPGAHLSFDDVIATWSGLRPLLDPHGGARASQVSREHHLYSAPGFVTIAGGKLTTFRRMAAEALEHALEQTGAAHPPCTTHLRALPGSEGLADDAALDALRQALAQGGLSPAHADALVTLFGVRASVLAEREAADPAAKEPLDPEIPWTMAQVDEAVDHELAATLDDVLSRRTPLLLRARDQGLGIAPKVAARMAARLGWNAAQEADQLARYQASVEASRRYRG